MSRDSAYSRLYRLINDSIRPYTEPEAVSLTKQQEKQLLASLSQVFRQIQLWTRELDCDSDDELKTHSKDHQYLSKLMADSVFLLTVKSQYVQHLAGNILVVISEFLATSGSNWELFIHSLCLCLELAVNNIFSLFSVPSRAEPGNPCFDLSSFVPIIRPRLKDAGWSTLAGVIRVLRNILKCLKQDYDNEDNLAVVYLDSVHSCLSNVHWDSMDVIYGTRKSCTIVSLDIRSVSQEEPRIVFLGNFIQLLCSLVEQSSCVDDADRSLDKHPILCTIANLVPKLLYWCLGKEGEHVKSCISQYFRHKLLLLHNYFQELLWQPIAQVESAGDDCLEGSPFVMSVSNGEIRNIHPHHVQRQAVFLLIRCSFILTSLREDTNRHCACATADSCLTFDSISDLDNCGQKRGLLELYQWIQGHLPIYTFLEYEMYMEKCINFSLSFLQLYMHEQTRRVDSYMDSVYTFDNAPNNRPTSLLLGPNLMSSKFYQLPPPEDLTLAVMLARPHPLYSDESMLDEAAAVTDEKYGSVHRVYIECDEDRTITEDLQRWMIENNPTDEVKLLSGSDHMPMFSKPKELCISLQEIAEKYP
ncbi:hypothetical protein LWI29_016477 [Acer saccharum]|uniref:Uncharacterized protein n=1 Tax=Acer saccharum TaxID=4024 RepID=A0AA39T7K4_ACESA|nr:hypothetical protein LWI29_016477 [Acer saccharum]